MKTVSEKRTSEFAKELTDVARDFTPLEMITKLMNELRQTAEIADMALLALQEILASIANNTLTKEGKFKKILFNLGSYGKATQEIKDIVEDFINELKEINSEDSKI